MAYALRMALRQFRLHPALALIIVLVLGLGTGAATVVYTIVDSVVLRPLPYRAPDRLVKFWDTNSEKGLNHDPISPVTFMDYKALPVFQDAAAWWRPVVNLVDPGLAPVRVNTIEASANLFSVLGIGTFPPPHRPLVYKVDSGMADPPPIGELERLILLAILRLGPESSA